MAKRTRHGLGGRVAQAYDQGALARVCAMDEESFGEHYGMDRVKCRKNGYNDFYFFKDNGSQILAVGHLDTVAKETKRAAHFTNTEAGPVVFSRALDDRLGVYTILELLPNLREPIVCDWLLTTGEESGQSTAEFFKTKKEYNWIIEFDRGGTDVVMYQFEDKDHLELIRAVGAKVGVGIFSDIGKLDKLGCKAFNWGIGYQDYHSSRSHAYLVDTFDMVEKWVEFYEVLNDVHMPHEYDPGYSRWGGYGQFDDWETSRVTFGPKAKRSGSRYGGTNTRDYRAGDYASAAAQATDDETSTELVRVADPFVFSDDSPGVVLSKEDQAIVLGPLEEEVIILPD